MMRNTSILVATLLVATSAAKSQELEPRRWSHLPVGGHFLGGGVVATQGDILFDPLLLLEDVEMDMTTSIVKYIHSFELFSKSARLSLAQGHQMGEWSGLLDGAPASTKRVGLTDTIARFAINLKGAPPLSGQEFQAYRGSRESETIVGLGFSVQLPTGEYLEEKLVNLGSNRFTYRSQLGVVHSRGNWSFEATVAAWIFTENDDFFGGNKLEQDPLYFVQGHVIRTLQAGRWAGLSIGYSTGGEATVNGVEKDNSRQDLLWAVSYGFALSPTTAIKFAYLGTETKTSTGLDSGSLAITLSTSWSGI